MITKDLFDDLVWNYGSFSNQDTVYAMVDEPFYDFSGYPMVVVQVISEKDIEKENIPIFFASFKIEDRWVVSWNNKHNVFNNAIFDHDPFQLCRLDHVELITDSGLFYTPSQNQG